MTGPADETNWSSAALWGGSWSRCYWVCFSFGLSHLKDTTAVGAGEAPKKGDLLSKHENLCGSNPILLISHIRFLTEAAVIAQMWKHRTTWNATEDKKTYMCIYNRLNLQLKTQATHLLLSSRTTVVVMTGCWCQNCHLCRIGRHRSPKLECQGAFYQFAGALAFLPIQKELSYFWTLSHHFKGREKITYMTSRDEHVSHAHLYQNRLIFSFPT